MKKIPTIANRLTLAVWIALGISPTADAQRRPGEEGRPFQEQSWRRVATGMPDEWYGSEEARKVADNVLFCQQDIGGWQKNKPYHKELSEEEKEAVLKMKSAPGATIDNGATITEMRFLAKVYSRQPEERFWKGFLAGFDFLMKSQYDNGGWPQFYPPRTQGSVSYSSYITYNDNAMVNVMRLLADVAANTPEFQKLPITDDMRRQAKQAFDKGVDCILKTQIVVNGKRTVWCAQHDEVTLKPAKARAYELPSFSGAESLGIIQLLMSIKNPSKEVVEAVDAAVKWLDEHKITGRKVAWIPDTNGVRNATMVEDPHAAPLIARFYDLNTEKPFVCDRDGIKREKLEDLGADRRNGYSWFSGGLTPLLEQYHNWSKKLSKN